MTITKEHLFEEIIELNKRIKRLEELYTSTLEVSDMRQKENQELKEKLNNDNN